MNKLLLALVAITIITASVVAAPYSTEARNESDTRSTPTLRYSSIAELRTHEGDRYRKRDISDIRLSHLRTDKVKIITNESNTTPSPLGTTPVNSTEKVSVSKPPTTNPIVKVDDTVTENTQSTPSEVTPIKNEVESVVKSEETVNNDSTNAPSDEYMTVLAGEIHRLTNVERERAGVPMLGYDEALAAIATGHSEDMALNNYFSHTAQDGCTLTCRFNEAGYIAWSWGENIAWRSSSQLPEAKELAAYFVEMWMNSEGHRLNMLSSKFTLEGVGLARVGDKVYATVNFANPQ